MPYSSGKLVFQIIVGMKFNVFYARVVQSGVSIAGTGSAKECCCSMVTRSVNISVWGALWKGNAVGKITSTWSKWTCLCGYSVDAVFDSQLSFYASNLGNEPQSNSTSPVRFKGRNSKTLPIAHQRVYANNHYYDNERFLLSSLYEDGRLLAMWVACSSVRISTWCLYEVTLSVPWKRFVAITWKITTLGKIYTNTYWKCQLLTVHHWVCPQQPQATIWIWNWRMYEWRGNTFPRT